MKMKLTKVNYNSAVYFGVISFIFSIISGAVQLMMAAKVKGYANLTSGVSTIQVILYFPLAIGLITYFFALIVIWVYNGVAKKFPISWEVEKEQTKQKKK